MIPGGQGVGFQGPRGSRNSPTAELIFFTNITNYILGEKIVMWRNFGKFCEVLRNFGKFCNIFRTFMWRKIKPKSTFVEQK